MQHSLDEIGETTDTEIGAGPLIPWLTVQYMIHEFVTCIRMRSPEKFEEEDAQSPDIAGAGIMPNILESAHLRSLLTAAFSGDS